MQRVLNYILPTQMTPYNPDLINMDLHSDSFSAVKERKGESHSRAGVGRVYYAVSHLILG